MASMPCNQLLLMEQDSGTCISNDEIMHRSVRERVCEHEQMVKMQTHNAVYVLKMENGRLEGHATTACIASISLPSVSSSHLPLPHRNH